MPESSAHPEIHSIAKDVVDGNDPRALIWELLRGQWRFSALYAFVDLDLASRLSGEPLTLAELASHCALDQRALVRLLRTMAGIGVVRTLRHTAGPDKYTLTDAGQTLRAEAHCSMRSVVIPQGAPHFLAAMGSLAEAVRHGKSPFAARYGSMYAYLECHPEARQHFDAHMATRSRSIAEAVVDAYDFTGLASLVDLGGGVGTILAAILRATPELRGTLFDLDQVMAGAQAFLTLEGVADRCTLISGDFFSAVPIAEGYLLSNILHNWNDDDALRILRNLRAVIPDHGRVLFLDMLLPADDRPHLGKELDMRMLALYDGALERSRDDYLDLLARAGLCSTRVIELPSALSLIEARPAGTAASHGRLDPR